ncbi:hypothetical protein HY571_01695, partial [Candidatus Micrarchaeota archaeon]|nr:hypothetical protein [Candidatus Micrarchaeota archaeon]
EELIKTLGEKGEQEENAIISAARIKARETVQQAEKQAKHLVEQGRLEGQRLGQEARAEISATTRLREKRIKAEAHEQAIENALQGAEKKLKQLATASPEYEKLLESLANNCVRLLGKDAGLLCRKKDEARLKKKFNITGNVDITGGVIGRTVDQRIKVDNSLEALFALHREKLKQTAYYALLGQLGNRKKTVKKIKEKTNKGKKK